MSKFKDIANSLWPVPKVGERYLWGYLVPDAFQIPVVVTILSVEPDNIQVKFSDNQDCYPYKYDPIYTYMDQDWLDFTTDKMIQLLTEEEFQVMAEKHDSLRA